MNKEKIRGAIVPIITPVDEHENVAEDEFRALLRHCINGGLHGVFVAGSNGEALGLTQRERDRAIRIAIDEVGDDAVVLCGVMDSSSKRVIENVKRMEDLGGHYAVLTPVFYARHATQQENVRLFENVASETSAELLIYNVPLYTGEKLTPETIFEISKVDKVIGYKDTSGSMSDFLKCRTLFAGSDFSLLAGSMSIAAPAMLMGADGYIPSMAPLFPKLFVRLYENCRSGNIKSALRCNELMNMTMDLWKCAKNQTSATKYAISCLGLCGDRVIRPTEPLTESEKADIRNKLSIMTPIIEQELAAGL